MKHNMIRTTAMLLVLVCLFTMSACQGQEKAEVNGEALFQVLLEKVSFASPLTNVGEDAPLYFPQLPTGAEAILYTGSGYYADRLALLTLSNAQDIKLAEASVQEHLQQLRSQFQNYIPEEVFKVDEAVIWSQGCYMILCVTGDYENAQQIVDNAVQMTAGVTVTDATTQTTQETTQATTQPQTEETTQATTEATTVPETTQETVPETVPETTQAPTEPVTEATEAIEATETTQETEAPSVYWESSWNGEYNAQGYPMLTSKSGTWHNYKTGAYRVDNTAFENYKYDEASANAYAAAISKVADALAGQSNVYCLAVPTAIGVVMPDDVAAAMPGYENQGERIGLIYSKMSQNVKTVECFHNLMTHRNEYLYFKTDFHWNGKAAYYAYESWCQAKGITPYGLDARALVTFDNFWGALYQNNAGKDPLLDQMDTVEAYSPVSHVDMTYTDKQGNLVDWPVIADVSGWAAYSKYNAFGGGDNPITEYINHDVTDGSLAIVVKESFGNAMMPYFVDHYSRIIEIDYRYWEGDLIQYVRDTGAVDVIFVNNMGMIRASTLVGMLNEIIIA